MKICGMLIPWKHSEYAGALEVKTQHSLFCAVNSDGSTVKTICKENATKNGMLGIC